MKVRKEKVALIKESYVAITGDFIKAVILNQLVYWSLRIYDFDEYIKEESERLRQNGIDINAEPLLTHGWIYKTAEELSEETMLNLSHQTMRRYLEELIQMGYISKRNNPLHKYDRTYQYRVNLVKIKQDIVSKGYTFDIIFEQTTSTDNTPNIQNGHFKVQNGQAIPETNTDIYNNNNNIKDDEQLANIDSVKDIKERINEDVRFWTGRPTPLPMGELSQLEELYRKFGRDRVYEAMGKAREQNKWSVAYIKAIINNVGQSKNVNMRSKKRNYDDLPDGVNVYTIKEYCEIKNGGKI